MSIAKHTVYNVAGKLLPMLVSVVTVPFYLQAIGLERFGVLSICWMLLGYFGLFDFGLGRATAQRIAVLIRADPRERADVFWTSLWLNLGLGVAGGLVLFSVGGLALAQLEGVTPELDQEIQATLPWLAATLPIATVGGVLSGALQGRERFLASNAIDATATVLMSVLPLLAAVAVGPKLQYLVMAALLGRVASLGFLFEACRRAVPLKGGAPKWHLVRSLLIFGGWVTAANTVTPLLMTFDRFAVGALINAAAVSIYVVPSSLVSRMILIPQGLTAALFPRFASNDIPTMDRLQLDAMAVLASVMTPAAILAMAAMEPFLHVWIGSQLARLSAPVAHVLILAYWLFSFARVPAARIQAGGRPDIVAKIVYAEVVPYLILLYFALSSMGVIGAAVVWCIRSAADTTIFLLCTKSGKTSLKSLVAPGAMVSLSLAIVLSFPATSPVRWILLGLLLIASCSWSWRTMPPNAADRLRKTLARLLPLRLRRGLDPS